MHRHEIEQRQLVLGRAALGSQNWEHSRAVGYADDGQSIENVVWDLELEDRRREVCHSVALALHAVT